MNTLRPQIPSTRARVRGVVQRWCIASRSATRPGAVVRGRANRGRTVAATTPTTAKVAALRSIVTGGPALTTSQAPTGAPASRASRWAICDQPMTVGRSSGRTSSRVIVCSAGWVSPATAPSASATPGSTTTGGAPDHQASAPATSTAARPASPSGDDAARVVTVGEHAAGEHQGGLRQGADADHEPGGGRVEDLHGRPRQGHQPGGVAEGGGRHGGHPAHRHPVATDRRRRAHLRDGRGHDSIRTSGKLWAKASTGRRTASGRASRSAWHSSDQATSTSVSRCPRSCSCSRVAMTEVSLAGRPVPTGLRRRGGAAARRRARRPARRRPPAPRRPPGRGRRSRAAKSSVLQVIRHRDAAPPALAGVAGQLGRGLDQPGAVQHLEVVAGAARGEPAARGQDADRRRAVQLEEPVQRGPDRVVQRGERRRAVGCCWVSGCGRGRCRRGAGRRYGGACRGR